MARPTKLTPELQEKICRLIAATGCTVEGAAATADGDARRLYHWRSRGLIEGKGPYFQFCQELTRARAKSESTLALRIAQASQQDWRAAAFILERRFPDQWGNRLTLIKRLEQMTEDELDAYLAERLGGAGLPDEAGARDQALAAAGSTEE